MGLSRRPSVTAPADHAGPEQGSELGLQLGVDPGAAAPLPAAVLEADLLEGDSDARRGAALALWGDPSAVPLLLTALDAEADPVVRDALLTVLAGHDEPQVGGRLAQDLRSEDVAVRNSAVRALQTMPAAVEALVHDGILDDGDQDVRVLAVMVLSTVPHPEVPTWLLEIVERDAGATVVAAAVDAATTVGGELAAACAGRALARFPEDPYLLFMSSVVGAS